MPTETRIIRIWFFVLLVISFLALIFAGLAKTALVSEGTVETFIMLDTQKTFYFGSFWREVGQIWQIPSVLIIKLLGPDRIGLALDTLFFVVAFRALVSPVFAYFYLKAKGRLDLLIFPLLAFGLIDLPIHLYPYSEAGNALIFFWPAFLMVWLRKRGMNAEWGGALIALAALSVTYESVVLAYPLLWLVSLLNLRAARWKDLSEWVLLTAISALGIWSAWRLRVPGATGTASGDLSGWVSDLLSFSLILCLFLILQEVLGFFEHRVARVARWVLVLGAALVGWAGWGTLVSGDLTPNYFNGRLTCMPLTLFVAIMMWVFTSTRKNRTSDVLFSRGVLATVLFLFGFSYFVYGVNRIKGYHDQIFERMRSGSESCQIWDGFSFIYPTGHNLMNVHALHLLSILFQKTYQPTQIVFAPEPEKAGFDFCSEMKKGPVAPGFWSYDMTQVENFDFSVLFGNAKPD